MKALTRARITGLTVLLFAGTVLGSALAYDYGTSAKRQKDIVDTAISAGSFQTLVVAVQAADLVDTLKGTGPFTVFAPTNEAFDRLPDGTLDALLADIPALTDILLYHVVPGKVMAASVVGLDSADTDDRSRYGGPPCGGPARRAEEAATLDGSRPGQAGNRVSPT